MQKTSTARGVNSPFHIALLSSKKFAVYYAMRDLKLASRSASFLQLSKNLSPICDLR
jgi:hypothetical protein